MAKSRRVATAFLLTLMTSACATGQYTPLVGADRDEVEQLKENVYRVEYRVSSFTSQEQLDAYLRRRCAELTLREGYDFFHLAQRADVLALSRRTSMTVTMYKGKKPVGADDVYDAKAAFGLGLDAATSFSANWRRTDSNSALSFWSSSACLTTTSFVDCSSCCKRLCSAVGEVCVGAASAVVLWSAATGDGAGS